MNRKRPYWKLIPVRMKKAAQEKKPDAIPSLSDEIQMEFRRNMEKGHSPENSAAIVRTAIKRHKLRMRLEDAARK